MGVAVGVPEGVAEGLAEGSPLAELLGWGIGGTDIPDWQATRVLRLRQSAITGRNDISFPL